MVVPADAFYPGQTAADWRGSEQFLEPVFGEAMHLYTLGGFVIRHGDRVIVVDTGVGVHATFPFVGGGFRSAFAATGLRRDEVTDVVFTHLHVDHIGWTSVDGKAFFPNAVHRVDRRDFDLYCAPDFTFNEVEAAYCTPETDAPGVRLGPVMDRIELFEGDDELLPGLSSIEASGHTPGETVLRLTSAGESGLFLGDTVHTAPELYDENARGQWNFCFHHDEAKALESLERIRRIVIDEGLPVAGAHFPGLQWGRVTGSAGSRTWERLD
ncbi:MBL fold metallo-hydrolase [Nakamurella alba]|nr:MBL fold metallo-hydrolase [Nakamurella alba]